MAPDARKQGRGFSMIRMYRNSGTGTLHPVASTNSAVTAVRNQEPSYAYSAFLQRLQPPVYTYSISRDFNLLRKQMLQSAPERIEALEDPSGSLNFDAQSQGSSPGDASTSPGFLYNPLINYPTQYSGRLDSSYGDSLLVLDGTTFAETSAVNSALDHQQTSHTLPKSPVSLTKIEQMVSESYSDYARLNPLANGGNITSLSQDLYDLRPSVPSNDSSCSSEKSASGWLSPLHIAARKGHDRIVHVLLQHNVDCNEKDSDGLTPMIHAIIGGHEDVLRSLLLNGACTSSSEGQPHRSVLHWAVLHRRENLLRVLLNHHLEEKTSIDAYDECGRTPLHVAIDTNFEAGVFTLLQFGADPSYKAHKCSMRT
ncbi:MAG: hypothetical protein Q9170_001044 [Blastenia crenularia]